MPKLHKFHLIIIIIIITMTMFMVLSSLREFTRFIWWIPNQAIWAMSPPKDRLLPSADTIAIYYYYSARKLILILPSHGGWKVNTSDWSWYRDFSTEPGTPCCKTRLDTKRQRDQAISVSRMWIQDSRFPVGVPRERGTGIWMGVPTWKWKRMEITRLC